MELKQNDITDHVMNRAGVVAHVERKNGFSLL
jgi:hypothetical protein